ncbi:MAG: DUF349 domain-containing protein [Bacteroidaceae bacterium]|nr:DUF349 domain-containing protein [Bacteroidaceae bacterium]
MTENEELQTSAPIEPEVAETSKEQAAPQVEAQAAETTSDSTENIEVAESANDSQIAEPVAADTDISEAAAAESAPLESKNEEPETVESPADDASEPEEIAEPDNTAEEGKVIFETKEQVLERLKEICEAGDGGDRQELDLLKQVFYKFQKADQLAARNAFIEAGGNAEDYRPEPDVIEENFKSAMQTVREQRAKLAEEAERQKEDNLARKLSIIERIKQLATSPEEANSHFDEFKQLQAEWKEIKSVPAEKATEIWKTFQLYVEQFYDQLKLHIEAREYDFRKNLEAKNRIIEAAERLADETDIISAFNKLQALHADYKEIGPVAKELRESIWERFKAASTVINKRHQEHFEAIKAREEANLTRKTELCEQVEAIDTSVLTSFALWDEKTKEVLSLQAEWKTIGYAPHKMNQRVFDRFRVACDNFFTAKAEFFKTIKDEQSENLELKRKLVEEAEALQESTEWRKTTDKLIELQKRWKAIGAVPRKYSEQLWKRFTAACDHFFEAKQKATASARSEEQANLSAKHDIIEQLKALTAETSEATIEQVRQLQQQWNEVGHVPFRDKDKVYAAYREITDQLYKQFGQSAARRRLEGFQKSIRRAVDQGSSTLSREKERLLRIYEQQKAEIQTYETNLTFLSAKSKTGNSLVAELTKKVDKLKSELALLAEKIKAVDAEMRAPKAEESSAED